MLTLKQQQTGDTLLLYLAGELDHHAARQAIEQAEDLLVLYPCSRCVLELSGLTFMDSSGLAVALHLHRTLRRAGRELIVRSAPPQARRVFEAAGLPRMILFERGE